MRKIAVAVLVLVLMVLGGVAWAWPPHCDPVWHVQHPLYRTYHTATNCPPFPSINVDVLQPCASPPISTGIDGNLDGMADPLWECELDEEDMTVHCVAYYDEDVPIAWLHVGENGAWSDYHFQGCRYVHKG